MEISMILLETISIQKYVFSSSRLKVNLGASYLVKKVYGETLVNAIEETFGIKVNLDLLSTWKEKVGETPFTNSKLPIEIGYIGGGNALLFCSLPDKSREFVQNWSKKLLIEAPSLQTTVAIKKVTLSDIENGNKFKVLLSELFEDLAKNKNLYYPNTVLQKYGITADCSITGFSSEVFYNDYKDINGYISSIALSKLIGAKKFRDYIAKEFEDILKSEYVFTTRFDELGQAEGKDYLAIVHIDGNKMGARFKNCNDLIELRKLSVSVENAVNKAFKSLINYVVNIMPLLAEELNIKRDEVGKQILPIIPIIIAGDDITFVTDGRLGVHLAEKFIGYLSQEIISDNNNLTACAGVAIVKSKYPFYLAYELAESLCEKAKIKSRENRDSSWLDFHISSDNITGDIDYIRMKYYQVEEGNLHFGPYALDDESDIKHINNLKTGINDLNKIPRNKVYELRSVLPLGVNKTSELIKHLEVRGYKLPESSDEQFSIDGWVNQETPYFDMIDLMEFYPIFLLEGK